MNVIWVAVSAFIGGLVAAVLGWAGSGEPFVARKFTVSLITALITAVVFAIGYTYTNGLSGMEIGLAFLAGAGVDGLRNRASGAIKAGIKPL